MRARAPRLPLFAAGLTAILTAALAGCAASLGSGSSVVGSGSSAANPLDEVRLAAQTASGASSFTGTMALQVTPKTNAASGDSTSMTASFAEQTHPSLAEVTIGTLRAAGTSLPGGITEIVTPSTLYLKWSLLAQELHLTKPWLAVPLSAMSKSSGVDLSQLLSQAESSGPLTESQLLAGATAVRKVGTSTLNGVAVTEYTGTLPMDKGLGFVSASIRSELKKEIAAEGITTAHFTVWIDGQHTVRKAIVTEDGTTATTTITTTVSSLNQPVNIQAPASSQTAPLPSGGLGTVS